MSISLESVERINALKNGIEAVTGESYEDLTAGVQALKNGYGQGGDWDLVKFYYANLASDYARIFYVAPKDEMGANMDYRLPYIYTPKINWSTGAISTNLLEFGVDVSSTDSNNIGNNTGRRVFSPLPKLQRLIVTGNKNSQSLRRFLYQNTSLQYVKMETPSEEVLRLNSGYYSEAFYHCSSLETIDCELDFTGQDAINNAFINCVKLKDLRIKPFTYSGTSLRLNSCDNLHTKDLDDYESLISVLNAITNDISVAQNMTIWFSNAIKDNPNADEDYWDKNVYLDDDGLYYSTPENSRTEYSLYNAFINKGVTITCS